MNKAMIGRISILFFSVFLITTLFHDSAQASSYNPADSLRVKTINGQQFIMHKVEPRETWTQLARRYQCTVAELQNANAGVEMLKIDQIVKIPIRQQRLEKMNEGGGRAKTPPPTPSKVPQQNVKIPVMHTVNQGESLFAISMRFDQPVEKLKEYNNLTSEVLSPGQKLIVRYITRNTPQVLAQTDPRAVLVPSPAPKDDNTMASTSSIQLKTEVDKKESRTESAKSEGAVETLAAENYFDKPTRTVVPLKKGSSGKSMMQVTETGVATWIMDGQVSKDKYYGLHRSAPIGTIIKVTNRMNNQFVYVKIVGVLPDTGENSNVIIKLSQAVSEKLNVLDPLFQVEMSYGLLQ